MLRAWAGWLWARLLPFYGILPIPGRVRWWMMWLANPKFLVGAAGVIFNEQGQVLLFKHTYRGSTPWGLPGGWLGSGEDPSRAVEREVREESGLEVRVERLLTIHGEHKLPWLNIVVVGQFCGGSFRPSAEVSEVGFFDLDHLPRLISENVDWIRRARRDTQERSG